jgi:hypothetical protein
MKVYHIRFVPEDDWYCLQAVEDASIYSQARTLDEAVVMIRDVLDLLKGETDAELRLIIPSDLPVDDSKVSGRLATPTADDHQAPGHGEEPRPRQMRPPLSA